jgi:hypothetical protein
MRSASLAALGGWDRPQGAPSRVLHSSHPVHDDIGRPVHDHLRFCCLRNPVMRMLPPSKMSMIE